MTIHNFPFFLQHDTMDCGPTCLQMISTYYGKKLSLSGLREKCNLTKVGVTLLGISEAAEKIGFRTIGANITFGQLTEAPLPCIVHWNQQHFVVVYNIIKKKNKTLVYVADPGCGKLQYTQDEFCQCWQSPTAQIKEDRGIVLLLEPTLGFSSHDEEDNFENNHLKGVNLIFAYLSPYKKLIGQLFMGLFLGSILMLLLPFLSQSVVDIGINTNNIGFIYLVLIAQAILSISYSIINFIRGWILLHIGSRVNISLISDYLIKLMRMPIAFFDTKMSGDIVQRINDHTRIQDYLTSSALNTLFSIFNILVFGFVLCTYSFHIFSIFLVSSLLYVLWIWLFMKKRAELDHKNFAQQSANQSSILQLVAGMPDIKLNACEQQQRWKWESIQARLFRLRIKSLSLSQYQDSGAILINQLKNIIITAFVAAAVIQGKMTFGQMIAIQFIIGLINSPIDQLIDFLRKTQDARLSLDRLTDLQEKQDEASEDEQRQQVIPQGESLNIAGLSFSYNRTQHAKSILSQINITIPAKKITAIVGASGSGKTTLLKLILGFYDTYDGEIQLGQANLNKYSRREFRKQCGIVMQEGYIFSDTIARNIALGNNEIDKVRLLEATRIANIDRYIEALPLGYNTKIGNDGNGLSQGQKQRMLIARAIYKNPQYIFLDEATNSLDANNEKRIMENLNNFFRGRTTLIVAHRLSTVRNADQIIVLDKGQVVETGTHESLSQKRGAYYQLVKNQLEL